MKILLALILAIVAVGCAVPQPSYGAEKSCDFSSAKDFLAEKSAIFPVHGMHLDFHDNAGFNSQRPFLISRCSAEMESNCFRAAYFSFGVPKTPIAKGDSWLIEGEEYAYEQDVEIKLLGRSEVFSVVSRSIGGKLKSKFLVSEARGLAAIMFFSENGLADYQVYLQEDSCRPFPILIK